MTEQRLGTRTSYQRYPQPIVSPPTETTRLAVRKRDQHISSRQSDYGSSCLDGLETRVWGRRLYGINLGTPAEVVAAPICRRPGISTAKAHLLGDRKWALPWVVAHNDSAIGLLTLGSQHLALPTDNYRVVGKLYTSRFDGPLMH